MDQMKNKLRNEVIIGNAHLLDLEILVPDRPVRLLAMGRLDRNSAPASDNYKVEPLAAINYLVVGTGGDIHEMMEAVRKIKEKSPQLKVDKFATKPCYNSNCKVILADSIETPYFPKGTMNEANKPAGVERIIYISKEMSEASRSLLHHQAGILTGHGGGLAGGVAFTLANKIGIEATVAFNITNFDLSLMDQLQQ